VSDHQDWSTPAGLVALAWVLACAALAWFVLLWVAGADAPGRLLAAVAAVGLGLAALSGTRARPRLSAGPDGLTVRRLTWTLHVPWSGVDRVRVLRTRRLGRETSLLELDLRTTAGDDERLVVLGRLELGEDPEDVADALHARLG
jgi:hypothetical protein